MTALIILAVCAATGLWLAPARLWGPGREPNRGRWHTLVERRRGGKGRDPRDEAAMIGAALTSVAARLRAGQDPTRAWHEGADALPARLAEGLRALASGTRVSSDSRDETNAAPALRAARAATALAHDLGAELAPVLEVAADGIEESARAHADREAALAAPRATARLLLGLPLLGIAMGALMGARPWELFTTSVWGGLLIAVAAGLVLTGRWWIRLLIHEAMRDGGGGT